MLTNSHQLLAEAKKNKKAIGAFNTSNLEITQAILGAAESMSAPVIVQTSLKAIKYAGYDTLVSLLVTMAQKASVPVVLHLDHGDFETAMKVINDGRYTSVMFDGSQLPPEENIEKTKQVVQAAHLKNISVEAEVGAIGHSGSGLNFTSPEDAKKFAEATGCDSLAIAFGNLHGQQTGEEKLNFDVLSDVATAISLPIVFHGASNLSKEEYHRAIDLGAAKVNIDTEIRQSFSLGLRQYLQNNLEDIDPRNSLSYAREKVKEIIAQKIKIFSVSE